MECNKIYTITIHRPQPMPYRERRSSRYNQRHTAAAAVLVVLWLTVLWLLCCAFLVWRDEVPPATQAVKPTQRPVVTVSEAFTSTGEAPEAVEPESDFVPRDIPLDADLQSGINDLCDEYGVPFAMVLAMMERESSFRPGVVGDDGRSFGLMQIRDVNHEWVAADLGFTVPEGQPLSSAFLDPLQNAEAGIYMISRMVDKYGDLHLALMAYNHGEAGAKRLWDQGVYSSNYSRSILEAMSKYESEVTP